MDSTTKRLWASNWYSDETIERQTGGLVERLKELVEREAGEAPSFDHLERVTLAVLNELARRLLQAELQRRANVQAERLEIEGWTFRRHMPGRGVYHSLVGDLVVERHSYRPCRERNGRAIIPLDVETGMVARCTPALAYGIAQGFAAGPLRHYEAQLKAAHRNPPSRSTMERVAQSIAGEVVDRLPRLEPLVRAQEALPPGAHAISIGLDRTTVPMSEPLEEGSAPATRRKKRTRPYIRKPRPPVDVKYRMAYVATITVVDRDARSLVTRRYGAPAEEGPHGILERLKQDLVQLREWCPKLPIVVVQDGASELWGLMWTMLDELGIRRRERIEVIDRYHVTEHLAAVLDVVERDPLRRAIRLAEWNDWLDNDDKAMKRIYRQVEDWTYNGPKHVGAKLAAHERYLWGVAECSNSRYAWLRRNGFPQASGVTEGACKSLITTRAKRSGQRWSLAGISSVLALRALYQSERLEALWPLLQASIPAEVRAVM